MNNRRTRIKNLPKSLTKSQWSATIDHFGGLCAYCDSPWEHKDHFFPACMGGGYTKGNMIPSCSSCNQSKGAMHPRDFCDEETYFQIEEFLLTQT